MHFKKWKLTVSSFFDPVTVQNTFIEFTMYILFFQLPLLVTNPRFMLAAAFDLGHAASRSNHLAMGVHRKESRKQGIDDVQINKSLSTIAVNMTAQMTETALSHKATNASVHRRRRNDYDDIYKWQEEEYEEDDEEEMKEYLIWCSTFQESCSPCCPQALKDVFKSFYTDPMYEKVRELGEAFGVEITFTTYEKIKENYGAEGQYDDYTNPLGLPYM
ncbi:uncharacterized protein LOC112571756 isoform X2 [Pomacea canaliculata]|uniref:uncharacterized protein LOC112571756 isoform X2 n=1 Tax=Pomacea canaliculata TaxID=400727 RepID=UPI000D730F57|nr:uncharacterized protein LOC112571756 isoform X2 [Pomacea canaliculata]